MSVFFRRCATRATAAGACAKWHAADGAKVERVFCEGHRSGSRSIAQVQEGTTQLLVHDGLVTGIDCTSR